MSALPICRPISTPPRKQLAIGNPAAGFNGYEADMVSERDYWQGVRGRAFDNANSGMYDVAGYPHAPLSLAVHAEERRRPTGRPITEQHRRIGLGSLALGRLMRNLVHEDTTTVRDPIATDTPVGMYVETSVDDNKMPNDIAVYLAPGLEPAGLFPKDTPPDGWYQRPDGLIIRRTQPIGDEASPSFNHYVDANQGRTSLGPDAVRLMPYMPAQSGTTG